MIISFSRNFLFVAVPRTGSHALRESLRPMLGPHDWEQASRYEARTFPVPRLAAIGHGHIPCAAVRPFILPEIWARLFRFGFVRDPLDRFVSAYYFLNRTRQPDDGALPRMKALIQEQRIEKTLLLMPQHRFLCDEEGEPLVDFIGRFETLAQDFAAVCERIGCTGSAPDRVNASPRPEHASIDAELREMITEFYAADYRLSARCDNDAIKSVAEQG